ncbi:hypothetical protein KUIN1_26340 [Pseudomonas sp. KUIN-1]|nr:hypothetical protein KUIN1_26340 [Pseudomonas sp. KUIN-1]
MGDLIASSNKRNEATDVETASMNYWLVSILTLSDSGAKRTQVDTTVMVNPKSAFSRICYC